MFAALGRRRAVKQRYRTALRAAVSSESKAYGFTLVIWGTGALAMSARGTPGTCGAVSYIGGALVAMAAVVMASFGGPMATWTSTELRRLAWGAVHLGSVAVAMAAGWGAAEAISLKWLAYFTAGLAAALLYQLVLALEVAFSQQEADDAA